MRDARFWDVTSGFYDAMWGGPVIDALRDEVTRCCADAVDVIDIGCGTGAVIAGVARGGARVIGVDLSERMLRRALAMNRVTLTVHADAERIPLEDHAADAVVITNLIHVHPQPSLLLREALRLLRPGGALLVSWPVDALSASRMRRADRAAGRGLWASALADLLRRATGLLAAATVASRTRQSRSSSEMEALVRTCGASCDDPVQTIAGCQRLLVAHARETMAGPDRAVVTILSR